MKVNKLRIATLSLLFTPLFSIANDREKMSSESFYIGADAGYSSWFQLCDGSIQNSACDDSSLSYMGKIGYLFDEGIRLEVEAGKLGDFTNNNRQASVNALAARLGYDFYAVNQNQFTAYLGIQGRFYSSDLTELDDYVPEVGLGYQYYLSPTFSLGLSYFHGFDLSDEDDIGVFNAGFHYYFGQNDQALSQHKVDDGQVIESKKAPAPSTKAVVKEAKEHPIKEKLVKGLSTNLYFNTGSADPMGLDFLSELIDYMEKNPRAKVHVVGHTDSIGSASNNWNLSVKRANAVRRYLISKGIIASRIVASGKGETQPLATNSTSHGRLLNRRVELRTSNQ